MGQPVDINFGVFRVRFLRPTAVFVSLGPTLTRSYTVSEGTGPMDLNLGDNQFTTIHLTGVDAAKQAGRFTKAPSWEVDDPTVVRITPSPDGTACRVEAADPIKLGTAVLTATDVDDPTIPPIEFVITITGEQVTSLGATIDPPTEKTATTP